MTRYSHICLAGAAFAVAIATAALAQTAIPTSVLGMCESLQMSVSKDERRLKEATEVIDMDFAAMAANSAKLASLQAEFTKSNCDKVPVPTPMYCADLSWQITQQGKNLALDKKDIEFNEFFKNEFLNNLRVSEIRLAECKKEQSAQLAKWLQQALQTGIVDKQLLTNLGVDQNIIDAATKGSDGSSPGLDPKVVQGLLEGLSQPGGARPGAVLRPAPGGAANSSQSAPPASTTKPKPTQSGATNTAAPVACNAPGASTATIPNYFDVCAKQSFGGTDKAGVRRCCVVPFNVPYDVVRNIDINQCPVMVQDPAGKPGDLICQRDDTSIQKSNAALAALQPKVTQKTASISPTTSQHASAGSQTMATPPSPPGSPTQAVASPGTLLRPTPGPATMPDHPSSKPITNETLSKLLTPPPPPPAQTGHPQTTPPVNTQQANAQPTAASPGVKPTPATKPKAAQASPAPADKPAPQAGPKVKPTCRMEHAKYRPPQNDSVSVNHTSIGGGSCKHHYNPSPGSTLQLTGVSVAASPSNGTLTQTGGFEFKYQPKAGFKGSDHYTIKVCGNSPRGAGCSTLSYNVTVQ